MTSYSKLCTACQLSPLPVTFTKVVRWLVAHFMSRSPPSAQSLPTMKSNLKGCITKGFGKSWVDDDSDRLLADAIAGMKRLSIPETCCAFALLDCVIQKIRGDSGGLHTLYDDQWMSITQHSRASMMRAQDRADGKSVRVISFGSPTAHA